MNHFPPKDGTIVEFINKARPRYMKSHLFAELLPDQVWTKNSKLIYVARNPKDVIISWYHFLCGYLGYKGSKERLLEAFLNDQTPFTSFFDHILSYWTIKDRPNILFLTYEDMKSDLISVLKRIASFLGKQYSEDQYQELADHLSVEKMRRKQTKQEHCNSRLEYKIKVSS